MYKSLIIVLYFWICNENQIYKCRDFYSFFHFKQPFLITYFLNFKNFDVFEEKFTKKKIITSTKMFQILCHKKLLDWK